MAKILLVEDDPFLTKIYKEIFTREGYKFDNSVGGIEGLGKAKSTRPDLIILDLMIPEMNGIEVLQHLKEEPETKEIPVVIMTNLSSEQEKTKAAELGAAKYLIKTQVDPEKLSNLVKELVPAS